MCLGLKGPPQETPPVLVKIENEIACHTLFHKLILPALRRVASFENFKLFDFEVERFCHP
jgi:hypothetical protein